MNVTELLFISALAVIGISLMAKSEEKIYQDLFSAEKMPPIWLRMLNHLIIVIPLSLLGYFFYEKSGLSQPLFTSIQVSSIVLSILCALLNAGYYYGYVMKKTDLHSIKRIEQSRDQVGILARIFYGGVVEEVMFRYGSMSFFVWLLYTLTANELISIWIGNLLAAILFALAHLPGMFQMKVKITKTLVIYSMGMNIIVGLFCGWLLWQDGLAAAILCHMLFHIVWYAFEKTSFGVIKKREESRPV
ncbi:hypothetical protein JOC78_002064 [Bacillus ectoiniformans]|uniref:CPBP family glutamic-type intramembrane protease n=1 Tax=Bacillus ectoiniformans TaxID=1494429 RepID=UPI00195A480E|nr:CPBP family glutamic-type intramembrane protease [Bacillus ectoiniformans]MBM7649111.1 hypothetical protein [Bacillus ectoiniformans]